MQEQCFFFFFYCLLIQNVLTKPAHPRSAASQSSLNACECEGKQLG